MGKALRGVVSTTLTVAVVELNPWESASWNSKLSLATCPVVGFMGVKLPQSLKTYATEVVPEQLPLIGAQPLRQLKSHERSPSVDADGSGTVQLLRALVEGSTE